MLVLASQGIKSCQNNEFDVVVGLFDDQLGESGTSS